MAGPQEQVSLAQQRMAEIRERALVCRDCPLCQTRTQVVFGDGNPDTPLMFIGEGPGEQEDATGLPFVGRAGHLLEEALRAHKITRKHVWISNVLKCRASVIEGGRVQNRPPRVEEIEACRPWIEAEIAVINPLVIICVGGPAAKLIIDKNFAISTQRGQWFTHTGYAPYAMAILHPAYILRQHGQEFLRCKQLLIDDLARARQKVIEARKEREEGRLPQFTLQRQEVKEKPPAVEQKSLFD
jgi:DNA polymerase